MEIFSFVFLDDWHFSSTHSLMTSFFFFCRWMDGLIDQFVRPLPVLYIFSQVIFFFSFVGK